MKRLGWSPRCCRLCGDPLEEWSTPLQPGSYTGCHRCAQLYVVDDDGELTPVLLRLEAPELQLVFDEMLAAWWARQGAGQQLAVDVDGTTERRAA